MTMPGKYFTGVGPSRPIGFNPSGHPLMSVLASLMLNQRLRQQRPNPPPGLPPGQSNMARLAAMQLAMQQPRTSQRPMGY